MKPALTMTRISRVLDAAAQVFDVPRRAIAGNSRTRGAARARQAVYAALYFGCHTSFADVGKALGRDHSTVIYGVQQAEALSKWDEDYAAALQLVREVLR